MAKQISNKFAESKFKLISSDKSNDAFSVRTISWNIEGLRRNAYNLLHFICVNKPLLIFLSEPQVFSCDIDSIVTIFSSYKFYLNSPDLYDPNLPLTNLRARGGTLALWHSSIDQYVTRLQAPSKFKYRNLQSQTRISNPNL